MKITNAEFLISAAKVSACPKMPLPEFAFIGRSNVGKSSLINFITGRKTLAKVSQTPGKTRLINHFLINGNWFLVDLPGYGFARIPRQEREKLEKLVYNYFRTRRTLKHTFLLVDSRLAPQAIDLVFMAWLVNNKIEFTVIFTKTDKLSKAGLDKQLRNYKNAISDFDPFVYRMIPSSILNHSGKEEILQVIERFLTPSYLYES
jgi:GTP-binding protein